MSLVVQQFALLVKIYDSLFI